MRVYVCACVHVCVCVCACACACACVTTERSFPRCSKQRNPFLLRRWAPPPLGPRSVEHSKKTATSYGNRPKSHPPDAVNIEVNKRRFGDRLFGLCSYSKSFGRGRLHRPARASRNAETSKTMKSTGTCREAVVRTSIHDTCGVRTHTLTDWRLKPAP